MKRKQILRAKQRKAGTSPGSLIHIGQASERKPTVRLLRYNAATKEEAIVDPPKADAKAGLVSWYEVDGLHDAETIRALGQAFQLHPLVLEDLMNTEHSPKLESTDTRVFALAKLVHLDQQQGELNYEHLGIIWSDGVVLTLHERPGEVFDPVRQSIVNATGRIRGLGADYLVRRLLGAVVDQYFVAADFLAEQMDRLEGQLLAKRSSGLEVAYKLRGEINQLRRHIQPLREALLRLITDHCVLISPDVQPFYRDLLDHCNGLVEFLDGLKDQSASLMELTMALADRQTNEVMKVLTIIATIFIPLTFVAGIYGMNFEKMPELSWAYGYPAALGVMLTAAIFMLRFFRKKGWL
jgi:magnesium transporter